MAHFAKDATGLEAWPKGLRAFFLEGVRACGLFWLNGLHRCELKRLAALLNICAAAGGLRYVGSLLRLGLLWRTST